MPKRLLGADFVRAILTIGVVTNHFLCTIDLYNSTNYHTAYYFTNGALGNSIISMFFILSGALLYKNNTSISSYKTFYFKRWKSIFPMFYIAYLIFYLPKVITSGTFFYKGNPLSILLSVFGIDGYFLYRVPNNYYILGEWFLGAIIIIYILYPLLLKLSVKPLIPTIIIICLHIWQVYTNVFIITDTRNLISCLISFWFGMLFMKYYEDIMKFTNKKTLSILCIFLIPLLFIKINFVHKNIIEHIVGYILFILLFNIGNVIMKKKYIGNVCFQISYLSYAIFLVHHRILYKILIPFSSLTVFQYILLLLFIVYPICMLAAYLLAKLCNFVMKLFSKKSLIKKE